MPKVIDLTGKRFGNLTVIEMAGRTKRGEITWRCQCDCGNEKIAVGARLRYGDTKSCGCRLREVSYKRNDLTGKRFGRLTVIGLAEGKWKKTKWLCKCDCGNEKTVQGVHLTTGHTQSCGCYARECTSKRKKGVYSIEDITGERYGKLTVIGYSHSSKDRKRTYWKCRCDCGNEIVTRLDALREGRTKSCGCIAYKYAVDGIDSHTSLSHHRLYSIHNSMIERCYDENSKSYKDYGQRGISVCDEWKEEDGFVNFYEWAYKNGYTDELTIDRIDVNGNYEPSNCRWVTMKVQNNNRRNNVHIEYNGMVKTISEWADYAGLKYSCLHARLSRGWSIEKSLITPSIRR